MILTQFILHAKNLREPKYEFLIKKREDVGTKYCNDSNHLLCVQIQWMAFM